MKKRERKRKDVVRQRRLYEKDGKEKKRRTARWPRSVTIQNYREKNNKLVGNRTALRKHNT